MPISATVEGVPAIAIYKVPPGMTKADFEQRMDDYASSLAKLPVAQESWKTFEVIVPNDSLREVITGLGLPEPQDFVIHIAQAHSKDHCGAVGNDPEAQSLIARSQSESGILTECNIFSADMHTTVHIPQADSRTHVVGIFKAHPDMSVAAFHAKLEDFMEAVLRDVSVARKNLLQHSLWFQKEDDVTSHIRTAGYRDLKDEMFVAIFETETFDKLVEVLEDKSFQEAVKAGLGDFPHLLECSIFCGDVFSKIASVESS